MARNTNGWIILDRGLKDSDIVQRGSFTLATWIKLLLMANWGEGSLYLAGQQVKLQRGQLATGLRELSPDAIEDPHLHKVRGALDYLQKTGRIAQATSNHGRIITILNYSQYQDVPEDDRKQTASEPQVDRKQTATSEQEEQENKERIPGPKVQKSDAYSQEFEDVYAEYPRKEGKKGGWKIYKREITTVFDREALLKAVRKYRAMNAGKEKKYLKHFDTFMNNWRDYVPTTLSTPVDNSVGNQALMSLVASRKFLKPIGE
jgi:hypothetical protein